MKFVRMTPTEDVLQQSNLILGRIKGLVPSEAKIRSKLARRRGEYRCLVELTINEEQLRAEEESRTPSGALDLIEETMREKIYAWRIKRSGQGIEFQDW